MSALQFSLSDSDLLLIIESLQYYLDKECTFTKLFQEPRCRITEKGKIITALIVMLKCYLNDKTIKLNV